MKPSLFFIWVFSVFASAKEEKVLICGVGRDVEHAIPALIQNVKKLGEAFGDYAVLLYENNSSDRTNALLSEWATNDPHVEFRSEKLKPEEVPPSRTEKIARARNIVLAMARNPKYADFQYLLMVDLDFVCAWPIEQVVKAVEWKGEWDGITANGTNRKGHYYDRYALRNDRFPYGPELLADWWRAELVRTRFSLPDQDAYLPVFSAFGGMAIYKTKSILPHSYSGTVTRDLHDYYDQITKQVVSRESKSFFRFFRHSHPHFREYLRQLGLKRRPNMGDTPIVFIENSLGEHARDYHTATCCEHVPLHASMALAGRGKIFIDPKMTMDYRP